MAMFLGLFALSVAPESKHLQDKLTMQTVMPLEKVSANQ
jgi:hypothetical protein